MSANLLTPWDLALLVKALVRTALALYGVSHSQLARLLGLESTARVDASLSDAAQLLRVIDLAQGALGGLAARCRQRIDTGRHARA